MILFNCSFLSFQKLIDRCFTARQHKIGKFMPIYQGGLLAQAFEDSQRGTNKTYSCMLYNEQIQKLNFHNNLMKHVHSTWMILQVKLIRYILKCNLAFWRSRFRKHECFNHSVPGPWQKWTIVRPGQECLYSIVETKCNTYFEWTIQTSRLWSFNWRTQTNRWRRSTLIRRRCSRMSWCSHRAWCILWANVGLLGNPSNNFLARSHFEPDFFEVRLSEQ